MSDCQHYQILVCIMLFSGILGGIGNYLTTSVNLTKPPAGSTAPDETKYLLARSLTMGIIASFIVPLFLSTISSDLLSKPVSNGEFKSSYLVLIGFCLLASLLSKQFIESLYNKIMKVQEEANKAADKANEANKKADKVEEALTEKEAPATPPPGHSLSAAAQPTLSDQITDAFTNSKFIWRSASGLTKELNVTKALIDNELVSMLNNGILEQKVNKSQQLRYKLKS